MGSCLQITSRRKEKILPWMKNKELDQIIASHPWLPIRITWEGLKTTNVQTLSQTNLIELLGWGPGNSALKLSGVHTLQPGGESQDSTGGEVPYVSAFVIGNPGTKLSAVERMSLQLVGAKYLDLS